MPSLFILLKTSTLSRLVRLVCTSSAITWQSNYFLRFACIIKRRLANLWDEDTLPTATRLSAAVAGRLSTSL